MRGSGTVFVFIILIAVIAGGFYLVLSDIRDVREQAQNLELNFDLLYDKLAGGVETIAPEGTKTPTSTLPAETGTGTLVLTAVLFTADSSPLLSPQTELTVVLERVTKTAEGVVALGIKAYTNQANSYSALEPANFFEFLNPNGPNLKPLKVRGDFNSIPPQSSVSGEVVFKVPPETKQVILEIGAKEGVKYYEIDFEARSYREAVLG